MSDLLFPPWDNWRFWATVPAVFAALVVPSVVLLSKTPELVAVAVSGIFSVMISLRFWLNRGEG